MKLFTVNYKMTLSLLLLTASASAGNGGVGSAQALVTGKGKMTPGIYQLVSQNCETAGMEGEFLPRAGSLEKCKERNRCADKLVIQDADAPILPFKADSGNWGIDISFGKDAKAHDWLGLWEHSGLGSAPQLVVTQVSDIKTMNMDTDQIPESQDSPHGWMAKMDCKNIIFGTGYACHQLTEKFGMGAWTEIDISVRQSGDTAEVRQDYQYLTRSELLGYKVKMNQQKQTCSYTKAAP
jgi:hypothetical protein